MPDRSRTRARRAMLLAGALAPLAAHAGESPGVQQVLFGSSGERIEGSGKLVDDERSLAGFDKLIVNGPLDVRVRTGDAERVVVRADDNIAPLVETSVLGSTLVVGLRHGASYRTRSEVQVNVQAKQLHGVTLRGAGDVRIDRVDSDVFEATLQGSGDIVVDSLRAETVAVSIAGNGDVRAKGTAGTLGAVIDGSGDLHLADLVARTVAVSIRGSGDARVHATDELQVSISGSGDVRYRGTPKITKAIKGSGAVEPMR